MSKIQDAAMYRSMLVPIERQHANETLDAFFEELRALRAKYKLPDVYTIVMCTVVDASEPDGEMQCMARMHNGDEQNTEQMTAWALGQEQAARQTRIARVLNAGLAQRKREARK